MKKITYSEAKEMFEVAGPGLIALRPSKGRLKYGIRPGFVNKNTGTRHIEVLGRNYSEHHLVWLLETGKHSEHRLEHIDGDKQNNRFSNLRQVIPERGLRSIDELRELCDYKDGVLTYKRKLSARSHYGPGDQLGYVNEEGYRMAKIRGKRYKVADLVWAHQTGEWPEMPLDHINRQRDDDRIENLREATSQENARNRTVRVDSTSGKSGVTRNKGKWIARISDHDGKRVFIGAYETKAEAIAARQAAEKFLGYSS